jgi:hypothetical protein
VAESVIPNKYRHPDTISTLYKTLSNTILSRLCPQVDEIIGDHQCGFRHNRTATDTISFNSSDTGERIGVQWESTEYIRTLHEAYDSATMEILYNNLMMFEVPKKLVRLIKICSTETYLSLHK